MTKADKNSPKLLIVIVNYFSANLIEKLIKEINIQPPVEDFSISIVCVDNSVDEGQSSALRKIEEVYARKVKLLFNERNEGFGNAINIGLKGQSFDFACFINPDVSLEVDTLPLLMFHALSNTHQGLWGGLTVDQYRQADFRHAWQEPSLKNTFAWAIGLKRFIRSPEWQDNYKHLALNENQPYSVDCISGCCLMISNSAWQATRGFDSDFFLYSEEVDLCRRARTLGYQPTVLPDAKLTHADHSSKELTHRITIIFIAKMQYAKKHHGLIYTIFFRLFIAIGSFIRAAKSLTQGRLNSAKVWLKLSVVSLFCILKNQPSRDALKPERE